jgi:hypothetical protein
MTVYKVVGYDSSPYREEYKDKFMFYPSFNWDWYAYDYLYNLLLQKHLTSLLDKYDDLITFNSYSIKNQKAFGVLKKKWLHHIIAGNLSMNVLGNRGNNYLVFNRDYITLDELCFDKKLTIAEIRQMEKDIRRNLVLGEDYSIHEKNFYFKRKHQALKFIKELCEATDHKFNFYVTPVVF